MQSPTASSHQIRFTSPGQLQSGRWDFALDYEEGAHVLGMRGLLPGEGCPGWLGLPTEEGWAKACPQWPPEHRAAVMARLQAYGHECPELRWLATQPAAVSFDATHQPDRYAPYEIQYVSPGELRCEPNEFLLLYTSQGQSISFKGQLRFDHAQHALEFPGTETWLYFHPEWPLNQRALIEHRLQAFVMRQGLEGKLPNEVPEAMQLLEPDTAPMARLMRDFPERSKPAHASNGNAGASHATEPRVPTARQRKAVQAVASRSAPRAPSALMRLLNGLAKFDITFLPLYVVGLGILALLMMDFLR